MTQTLQVTHILYSIWMYLAVSFLLYMVIKVWARATGRLCRPVATRNVLGVGVFFDHKQGIMSVFLLPMLGVWVQFGPKDVLEQKWNKHQAHMEFRYRGRVVAVVGVHHQNPMLEVVRGMRASFPDLYLKQCMDAWDNRKAA